MKFLEYTPLSRLNGFLNNVNLGECVLKGALEAYSCKLAGIDRKLSRSLEQQVLEYLAQSPDDRSSSPMGPLCSTASRRTLIHLILTMNHIYPDYDFSMVQAHNFSKECGLNNVKQIIENYLLEAAKMWSAENGGDNLLDSIWKAVDEVIDLADCDAYSYMPEFEGDPFIERGAIKLAVDDSPTEEILSDEDTIFEGMDME